MRLIALPWPQTIFLVYSSGKVRSSILFQNLYLQVSSKNSLFFRFLRSDLGSIISSLFRIKIAVPNLNSEYVGIIKNKKPLLIELSSQDLTPKLVWRLDDNDKWQKEEFVGYQLLSEYTLKEFNVKREDIKTALMIHWRNVNDSTAKIHGDLTHFNILINDGEVIYIDRKSSDHSKLFDFFYFYSYLMQCLDNCSTLEEEELTEIQQSIESIINEVCVYKTQEQFNMDFDEMNLPSVSGVSSFSLYRDSFRSIFQF